MQQINPWFNRDGGTAHFDRDGGAAQRSMNPSHLQKTAHTAVCKVFRPNTTSPVLPSLHVNGAWPQLASRVSHTKRGGTCFVLCPNTQRGWKSCHQLAHTSTRGAMPMDSSPEDESVPTRMGTAFL